MIFVALLYGAVFTLLGLVLLLQARRLEPGLHVLMQDRGRRLVLVFLFLPLGLFGLYFHNRWGWDAPTLAVTLAAWGICLEAPLWVLFPGVVDRIYQRWKHRLVLGMRLEGAGLLLLGLLSLWRFLAIWYGPACVEPDYYL